MEIFAVLFILAILGVGVAVVHALSRPDQSQERLRALTLSNVDQMNGVEFEHYAAALLRNEGYTNVTVTPASGDNGVDITATLGDRRYAIQAKRYKSTVSRRAVSDAVAGMIPYNCNSSMVITSGRLSAKAMEFAAMRGCLIIDRDVLADWIGRFHNGSPENETPIDGKRLEPSEWQSVPRRPATAQHAPTVPATGAVPVDVIDQIMQKARTDFPADYSTMEYQINCEIEAYQELRRLAPSDIPQDILTQTLERAAVEHPLDFSTQLYDVKDQLEAFRVLQKLRIEGIPGPILHEICARGSEEYPDDFSTRLYFIREESRAYTAVESIGRAGAV